MGQAKAMTQLRTQSEPNIHTYIPCLLHNRGGKTKYNHPSLHLSTGDLHYQIHLLQLLL